MLCWVLSFTSSVPRVDESIGVSGPIVHEPSRLLTTSSVPRVDENIDVPDPILHGSSRLLTTSSVPRVDESIGVSDPILHGSSRLLTTSSVPRVDESIGLSDPGQALRFRTTSSEPLVSDSLGVPALTDQGDQLLTTSSGHRVGDSHGVQTPDLVVGELVRVWDTPLPLQPVAVNNSEQVSAATLPIDEIATSLVIDTAVESQVEENRRTQRRTTLSHHQKIKATARASRCATINRLQWGIPIVHPRVALPQ